MDIISNNNRAFKAYKLGLLCLQSQKFTEALAHFCVVGAALTPQKIISAEFKKDLILAFDENVKRCMKNYDLKDVFACYNEVFSVFPYFEEIPHKISCLFLEIGEHEIAKQYLGKTLEINAHFTPAIMCMQNISNYLVERWHFRMLNDRNRNFKYRLAIQEAISDKQGIVLDIGTGTGLLSIFAAKAGYQNLFACDSSCTMCNICEKVVKANGGVEKHITVINKSSLDLEIGVDLPSKISLIFTEIFDAGLFGEGVLATLQHAWDKLLINERLEKGKVVPNSATVYFTLIQCPWIAMKNKVVKSNIECLTISEESIFISEEEYDDPYSSEFLNHIIGGYHQLSKPQELLRVNFNNPMEISEFSNGKYFQKEVKIDQSAGSFDAIAVWFDLNLSPEITISTSPESSTCWEQAIFPTKECLVVSPNSPVSIEFFCKDLLRLNKVLVNGQRELRHQVPLPSVWIRKLNDAVYCNYLEESIKEALANGRETFIDASPVPLGGIIAAKLGAKEVVFTEEAATKWIVVLSREFGVPFSTMNFYSVTKLTEMSKRYDALVFDPVDPNGMMSSGILQDLALLRSASLKSDFSIVPKSIRIWTQIIQSPLIRNYTRLVSDQNVFDLKISEFINKFQTKFFEDLQLSTLPHQALCQPTPVVEIDFKCPISELSESPVRQVKLKVRESGEIDAVVFWFEIVYAPGDAVLNTLNNSTSYCQAAVILEDGLTVTKEQVLDLETSYNHSIVYFNTST